MGQTQRIFLMIVAAAMLTVAIPRSASASSQVAFQATVAEIDQGEAFCPLTQTQFLCVTITGTGQATNLGPISGAITESAVILVDLSTADPVTGCAAEVRTSTLTAANTASDQVQGVHGAQVTLQGPGQVCGDNIQASGGDSWVVIGGNGRLANAVGTGSNSVSINRSVTPVTSVTIFSGTLSFPSSIR